eukprot:1159724-Pelagomonas_calceolata.AAC.12
MHTYRHASTGMLLLRCMHRHLLSLAASLETKCGRFDAARKLLDHGLRRDPKHAPFLLSRAMLEVKQKRDWQAARVLLQRALALNPKNTAVLQADACVAGHVGGRGCVWVAGHECDWGECSCGWGMRACYGLVRGLLGMDLGFGECLGFWAWVWVLMGAWVGAARLGWRLCASDK